MNWLRLFAARKSFNNLEEFYAELKSLCVSLEQEGYRTLSRDIHVLVFETAWTTSSEVLGELGLLLDRDRKQVRGDLRRRVDDCRYFAQNSRRLLKIM